MIKENCFDSKDMLFKENGFAYKIYINGKRYGGYVSLSDLKEIRKAKKLLVETVANFVDAVIEKETEGIKE